jgi:hypothetical protein
MSERYIGYTEQYFLLWEDRGVQKSRINIASQPAPIEMNRIAERQVFAHARRRAIDVQNHCRRVGLGVEFFFLRRL